MEAPNTAKEASSSPSQPAFRVSLLPFVGKSAGCPAFLPVGRGGELHSINRHGKRGCYTLRHTFDGALQRLEEDVIRVSFRKIFCLGKIGVNRVG